MPTYAITVPPSVNAIYANRNTPGQFGRRKTPKYKNWLKGEMNALIYQRAKPIKGPVSVKIVLPNTMRGDADNRLKGTLDLLVKSGLIENDSKKFVRSITVDFDAIEGMKVTIEPFVEKVKP
jgi:Holliday junction resolvase RusA-like endonuclease